MPLTLAVPGQEQEVLLLLGQEVVILPLKRAQRVLLPHPLESEDHNELVVVVAGGQQNVVRYPDLVVLVVLPEKLAVVVVAEPQDRVLAMECLRPGERP